MEVTASRPDTRVIRIEDRSQIDEARRRIGAEAQERGFDATRRGQAEIVASELATNLWLHGRGGWLLVRAHGLEGGLELIAVDRGPGMGDVAACLRDGYSTTGTAGNGLGAIRRLAQVFDLYSRPDAGTVVLAQLLPPGTAPGRFLVGAVCVALAGEPACGDAWSARLGPRGGRVCLADGLGHGPDAARAALGAVAAVGVDPAEPPAASLEAAHRAIAPTRGAAVALADLDRERGVIRYAGVGNIAGAVLRGAELRHMVSHNGIVGHQLRKAQEFSYPWGADALLVMHSDGLQTRWSLDAHPGLAARHPAVVAAVLHRDFARGRDDACVVVVREAG